MSEVAKIEEHRDVGNALTPMDLLNRAVESNADIEKLEKLMALQERWQAGEARKAFDAAMSEFASKEVAVAKTGKGHQRQRYSTLSDLVKAATPALAECGLSMRFDTDSSAEMVSVSCVISHEMGHFSETTLTYPIERDGPIKGVQALGSILTYLRRYALSAALGLGADEDDDGVASLPNAPREDVINKWVKELTSEDQPEVVAKARADLKAAGENGDVTDAEFMEIQQRWKKWKAAQ